MSGTEVEAVPPTQALERVPDAGLDRAARLGLWLAAAESDSKDPKVKGMAAALRIAYAESIGLPAHAASQVYVINGNLATSAQLQRAQAFTQGYQVVPIEQTETSCTVEVIDRKTNKPLASTKPVTFTIKDAERQKLAGKGNWVKDPAGMLFNRASTKAIRTYIPHVSLGVVAVEEVGEVVDGELVPFEDGD